jgi:DNA-binding GntR family transcriptional regulator
MSTSLDLIPQRSLAVEVIDRLREAILDGVFKPGELLNQVQIAARYGTSRGPIRDALAKLEEEGLVHNIPRRGTYVTKLDRKMVQDLFGLRAALETYGVRLAVVNCTPDDIAHLEALVKDMQQAVKEGDNIRVIALDMEIHQYLIELSGNVMLRQAWSNIRVQVRQCLTIGHHGYSNLQIVEEHSLFIDMLRRRDAEGLTHALVEHTTDICNRLVSNWHSDEE